MRPSAGLLHAMLRSVASFAALAFFLGLPGPQGASPSAPPELPLFAPEHMRWNITEDGLITSRANPDLRFNIEGGVITQGRGLVLWPCQVQRHEQFVMVGTQIQLVANEGLCLNVEGGIGEGNRIVTFHCGRGDNITTNEEFILDGGMLKMKHNKDMCVNVAGGSLIPGAQLILYRCSSESLPHEFFEIDGYKINVKSHPNLHFNVAGGKLDEVGQPVVLYFCHGAPHELFQLQKDDRIHVRSDPRFCLNAEGGLAPGHKIIVHPCSDPPTKNELWAYAQASGAIVAKESPNIGFNAAGGGLKVNDSIIAYFVEHRNEL